MATGTVTLDKAYFDTLIRRAQYHTTNGDVATPAHVPTITIHKTDHDSLLATARQYANLCRNLSRGGITEETLAILTKDDAPEYTTAENGMLMARKQQSTASYQDSSHDGPDHALGRDNSYTRRDLRLQDVNTFQGDSPIYDDLAYMPERISDGLYDGRSGNNDSPVKFTRQKYDKFAKRTVLLTNLPNAITHSDIASAVRGGLVLEIFLRTHDRSASVSFLEEVHAYQFFRHVKRYDLYIGGKRVEINWSERQFVLSSHVANKVATGATRNLVIHKRNPNHTEGTIRDDLEHIHNLVVIKITFNGEDAHISTNSIHNAMFARTCMMSRVTYKGCKIDWDEDECTGPIQRPQQFRKENVPLKDSATLMNRFQLLNMDGTEDSSQEEDDHDTGGVTFESALTASAVGIIA